jgi:uncharacterized iron-regulated membrane protein
MHTRLIEADTAASEPRTEADTTVAEQLLGALKAEPGYAGALNLTNADSGAHVKIILSQTGELAHRPLAQYSAAFLKALAQIAAISTGNPRPICFWTVNA